MMKFELHKVYDFQYAGVVYQNGTTYFLLTFEGNNTMPGFEEEKWRFRVEALPFQLAWEKEEIGSVFPCFVAGFVKDIDGSDSSFPILKQDIRSILTMNFVVGKSYPFTVTAVPGDLNEKMERIQHCIVQDSLGLKHTVKQFPCQKGDTVELTVDGIGNAWLIFADPVRQEIKETFKVGKEYDFLIVSEENDEKSGKNFFTVRDKVKKFLHHYYFEGEHDLSPGDEITLSVEAVSSKGWLILVEPGTKISHGELKNLEEIEDNSYGRENGKLEYKSSFVFTAAGEKNIDYQLGREIMQQLAAFMNAQGGLICLGYRDDGTICGINSDIPHLNSSTEDTYSYKATLDHIELKIRNTIERKLGGYALSYVDISFRKNSKGLLVCHLQVLPAKKPVYLNKIFLYKRTGNRCLHLLGDDITFHIIERYPQLFKDTAAEVSEPDPEAAAAKSTEKTTEVKPDEKQQLISYEPPAPPKPKAVQQYITLYKNGTATRQKKASASADALFNIPITSRDRLKKARLLFCYDNGCVNVLMPDEVINGKLKTEERTYRNGFNSEAKLLSVFLCTKDDFLVVRSQKDEDGTDMIKAVLVDNYATHEPQSMHTPGNKILEVKCASVKGYEVVPESERTFIHPIVVKSKNGAMGQPAQSAKLQQVMVFLKKRTPYGDIKAASAN